VFPDLLKQNLSGIVDLPAEAVSALQAHYDLLVRWNRVLNLTSVRTLEEAVLRHYCESVFLAVHLPAGQLRVADVGSGGGFPGLPVAVVRADCTVTLIESHQRKAVFLKEAARSLSNVRVLARRAEDVTEVFDHVISRAVSYDDLMPTLKRLGPVAYLLTGAEAPSPELGFAWEAAIPLPWGKQRFLRTGRAIEGPCCSL